jgi:hypothetical protein
LYITLIKLLHQYVAVHTKVKVVEYRPACWVTEVLPIIAITPVAEPADEPALAEAKEAPYVVVVWVVSKAN